MAIESLLVEFRDGLSRADAQAAIGNALENRGALSALAEYAEPVDQAGRVWDFIAPPAVAALSEPEAWKLAYAIRDDSTSPVVRAEPTFVVGGMREEDDIFDHPLTFGSGGGQQHLSESNDQLWAHKKMSVPQAWALLGAKHPHEAPGTSVVIGHPDSGVTQHPELVFNTGIDLATGRNFLESNRLPFDPLTGKNAGHGTATSSVFLSHAAIAIPPGVVGVSPGAMLVPLRMQDSVIHFQWGKLVRAIYHAADNGCHIISMSLGGLWGGDALSAAIRYAVERGVILIAASGNHTPFVCQPARDPRVLALAASNARDRLWHASATGKSVDVSAPGESVWRGGADLDAQGVPRFTVGQSAGTSYATAHTAGVCALWMHYHGAAALRARYGPHLAGVFRTVIQSSARNPGGYWQSREAGPGIVNAAALLQQALPAAPPPAVMHEAPAVHPRLEEIADIRNTSSDQAAAWVRSVMAAEIPSVEAVLDLYGAELSLHLQRSAFRTGPVGAPITLAGAAADTLSSNLRAAMPGVP